jgi:hypothetical protein
MSRIILWHKVKDFNAWKSTYDADKARRDKAGLHEKSLNRGKLDPNTLTVEWETSNPGIMDEMAADVELKKIMEKAGVIGFDYYVIK